MTKVPFIIRSETKTQIPTMVQLHALATVKWRMVVKHVDVTPRCAFIHQSQSQPYPFTAAAQDAWLLFRKGKSKTLTLIAVLGAVFGACGWTKASKPKNTTAHRITLLIRRSNFSMARFARSRFELDPRYFSHGTRGLSPHVIAPVLSENVCRCAVKEVCFFPCLCWDVFRASIFFIYFLRENVVTLQTQPRKPNSYIWIISVHHIAKENWRAMSSSAEKPLIKITW